MLVRIFLNYLFGYLNITVEGFFIERFINFCSNNKIFLWHLKKKNASVLNANVNINDFKKLRVISRKTKCNIKINSKRGVPFIFYKYKKRKAFIMLLFLVMGISVISSMYVWNIEIRGAQNIDTNELLFELKEKGLEIGKLKRKVDTRNIINSIRLERNDISWLEINLKGTNAIVSIVEAEKKPELIKDNEYCDIVSDKRGIVEKITAEKGTALVKKGDIIDIGTKLIGGFMEEKYTDTRYVHAKGEIKARVWYTKRIKSGFTREERKQTGVEKKKYSIIFNNFKINLYKSIPNFEKYDTINENKGLKLFSNFYLPIALKVDTYKEVICKQVTYGKVELQNLLVKELEKEFENENLQNITNKIVNVYQNSNNEMEIELTYETTEFIGREEYIGKD